MTVPIHYLRAALNVGHGLEEKYVRRYQLALDAILSQCEPHNVPVTDGDVRYQSGSEWSRGYRAGMRALAGALIAEMQRQIIPDAESEATP